MSIFLIFIPATIIAAIVERLQKPKPRLNNYRKRTVHTFN